MDITPLTTALLQLAGAALLAVGGIAVTVLTAKLRTYVDAKSLAAVQSGLQTALNASVGYGVVASQATIADKGWDHPAVKSAVMAAGLTYITARFPRQLAAAGLTGPDAADKISAALERTFPAVALAASASPATPPAPTSPVIVAPVPAA